jgi:hypothetical protein
MNEQQAEASSIQGEMHCEDEFPSTSTNNDAIIKSGTAAILIFPVGEAAGCTGSPDTESCAISSELGICGAGEREVSDLVLKKRRIIRRG